MSLGGEWMCRMSLCISVNMSCLEISLCHVMSVIQCYTVIQENKERIVKTGNRISVSEEERRVSQCVRRVVVQKFL